MDSNLPFAIDALLVFGKVVECRSLSKAAAALRMPKSTVSRQIAKLEADLGIKLLRKDTHRLTVTDLGERIYSHGLNILAEANDVRALVESNKREPQGMLRVAMPVFMGIDYSSRVGATFLERHPKSRLDIRLVDSEVHPIKDGFDMVFGVGPLQDSKLIARKLFTLESFLGASPGFVAKLAEPLTTPTQLNHLPFIDSGLYGGARKLALTKGRRRQELAPTVRARANNFQISKQYILQGLGVGPLPRDILCAEELRAGSIVPVLSEWSLEAVDVFAIYPFQLSYSNLIGAFYETALEVITQNIAMTHADANSAARSTAKSKGARLR